MGTATVEGCRDLLKAPRFWYCMSYSQRSPQMSFLEVDVTQCFQNDKLVKVVWCWVSWAPNIISLRTQGLDLPLVPPESSGISGSHRPDLEVQQRHVCEGGCTALVRGVNLPKCDLNSL